MARRTEICFFEDAEKIEGARLGCFTASTIFFRSCSFRLSFIQIHLQLFSRKKFQSRGDHKINLLQFLDQKDQIFFENGSFNLIERWKDVVRINGKYITD